MTGFSCRLDGFLTNCALQWSLARANIDVYIPIPHFASHPLRRMGFLPSGERQTIAPQPASLRAPYPCPLQCLYKRLAYVLEIGFLNVTNPVVRIAVRLPQRHRVTTE